MNFPIFIATLEATVFHVGAQGFGLLTSAMAVGSVAGALLAAWREGPTIPLIVVGAVVFGDAYILAAPSYGLLGLVLILVGASSQTVTTSTMSLVQMSTEPAMRGRVMALLLTVTLGGQPIGAPFVGWVANTFGPRWAPVAAVAGFVAATFGLSYLLKYRTSGVAIGVGRVRD